MMNLDAKKQLGEKIRTRTQLICIEIFYFPIRQLEERLRKRREERKRKQEEEAEQARQAEEAEKQRQKEEEDAKKRKEEEEKNKQGTCPLQKNSFIRT